MREMWVSRLADAHGIRTHLAGQRHFANHVTCRCANHAAAQNLPPACGMALCQRGVKKQQPGHVFGEADPGLLGAV